MVGLEGRGCSLREHYFSIYPWFLKDFVGPDIWNSTKVVGSQRQSDAWGSSGTTVAFGSEVFGQDADEFRSSGVNAFGVGGSSAVVDQRSDRQGRPRANAGHAAQEMPEIETGSSHWGSTVPARHHATFASDAADRQHYTSRKQTHSNIVSSAAFGKRNVDIGTTHRKVIGKVIGNFSAVGSLVW